MALGVSTNIGRINQGDTAELYAGLRQDEIPIDPSDIVGVSYTVQRPDGSSATNYGEINELGQGYLQWADTSQVGEYRAVATFTLDTGEVRSVVLDFFVEDPFALVSENPTQLVVDQVWLRLEDCFATLLGGPWLREQTLNNFDQTKIADFIPEVIFDINVQMPITTAVLSDFTIPNSDGSMNPNLPILVKGLLLRTITHLIRSYIEQPVPQGAQIVYEDYTRFAGAWTQYYQMEYQDYLMNLRLWKRQFLHLGRSALLVSSKSGRVWPGAAYRTRNVGRFGY